MEFSRCENCGKPIFFGPKTQGKGHHGKPNEWRHADTHDMKCAGPIPHAKPPHETWMRVRVQEAGPDVKAGKWPFTKRKYWDKLTEEWKEAFRQAGFAPE